MMDLQGWEPMRQYGAREWIDLGGERMFSDASERQFRTTYARAD
jgi:hypothetical protein